MSKKWFYVEGKEKVGPVVEEDFHAMIEEGALGQDRYVWRSGLDNWKKIEEFPELMEIVEKAKERLQKAQEVAMPTAGEEYVVSAQVDWNNLSKLEKIFHIMIGDDRGGHENKYGPYSRDMIIKLFKEHRINAETYIWVKGLDTWKKLAVIPVYEEWFGEKAPVLKAPERRKGERRPFIARMFVHNDHDLYEGVCRDISTGGMQILVADFPAKTGDEISLNVHPENTNYHFVARGKVVRLLDGGQGLSFRFVNLSEQAKQTINEYLQSEEEE